MTKVIDTLSGLTQNEDFVCGRGIICSEKRSVRMVHEYLNEDYNEDHGQKLKFCVSPACLTLACMDCAVKIATVILPIYWIIIYLLYRRNCF